MVAAGREGGRGVMYKKTMDITMIILFIAYVVMVVTGIVLDQYTRIGVFFTLSGIVLIIWLLLLQNDIIRGLIKKLRKGDTK